MKHTGFVKTAKPNKLMFKLKAGYYGLINSELLFENPNLTYGELWKIVNKLKYSSTQVSDYNLVGLFDSKRAEVYTMFLEAGFHNINPRPLLEWVGKKYDKYKLLHLWSFGRYNVENYLDYILYPEAGIVFYEGRELVTPVITTVKKNTVVDSMKKLFRIVGNKLHYGRASNEFLSIEQLGRNHVIALLSYNIFGGGGKDNAYSLIIWDYKFDKYFYDMNGVLTIGKVKKSLIPASDAVRVMKSNYDRVNYIDVLSSFLVNDKVLVRTHSKYSTIADKIIEFDIADIFSENQHEKEYYFVEVDKQKVWLKGFEHPVGNPMMSNNFIALALLNGHPLKHNVESAVVTVKGVKVRDYHKVGSIFSIIYY